MTGDGDWGESQGRMEDGESWSAEEEKQGWDEAPDRHAAWESVKRESKTHGHESLATSAQWDISTTEITPPALEIGRGMVVKVEDIGKKVSKSMLRNRLSKAHHRPEYVHEWSFICSQIPSSSCNILRAGHSRELPFALESG